MTVEDDFQSLEGNHSGSARNARFVRGTLRGVLLLLGFSALLLGTMADLLRSSGDRAFGGAQMGLVLVGLALLLSGYALKARSAEALLLPIVQRPWRAGLIAVATCLAVVLAIEAALAIGGSRPLYSQSSDLAELSLAAWWRCDQLGCRFDPNATRDAPLAVAEPERRTAAKVFFERMGVVNTQGFHDPEEFVDSGELRSSFKILALGDSFTFGFYAPLGQSWLELMTARVGTGGRVTVWNTGMPGAATVQAVSILEHFLPIMRPDLVLLGFYPGNDLDGNLHPLDNFYASGRGDLFARYKIGPDFKPVYMTPEEAYYRATGIMPVSAAGPLEIRLGRTRAGTWLLGRWARLRPMVSWLWSAEARSSPRGDAKREEAAARTERLLGEIKAFAAQYGARLLLLLIPGPNDLAEPRQRYQTGKRIVETLAIDYVEVRDRLSPGDYFPADEHWNAGGHVKVGRRVAERVRMLGGRAGRNGQ